MKKFVSMFLAVCALSSMSVNAFAQQVGLGGSSTGISFDLEQLARNAGQPQIADQIAAFKAGSSR